MLYYAISFEPTIIMALLPLVSEQSKGMAQTIKNLHQILDYLGTHPDTKIRYYPSGMILNVYSYVYYLSAIDVRSIAVGYFFL